MRANSVQQMEPARRGGPDRDRVADPHPGARRACTPRPATRRPPTSSTASAGAYIADMYYARMGDDDARQRMEIFHRAAAHQTTADNPGLIPETIVSPVVNFIEVARPICATLGPTDLGWRRLVVCPGHPAHPGRQAGR